MVHTTVQKRNLGRLLVGNRQNVLESTVAIAELVPAALLRLDALAANLFAAHVRVGSRGRGRKVLLIVVAGKVVLGCPPLFALALAGAGTQGVEAMLASGRGKGAMNGRRRTRSHGRVGAALPARVGRHAVGGQLTVAHERGLNAGAFGGSEGASRRSCCERSTGRVAVVRKTTGASEAQGIKAHVRGGARHYSEEKVQ